MDQALASRSAPISAYWQQRLAEGIEDATFPWCRRAAVYSWKGEQVPLRLPADTQARLKNLTGGSPFLQFAVLVAALKICLRSYSGNRSIAIGSPRYRALGSSSTTSPNAVLVLDRLTDDLTFRTLLMQVRKSLLAAYDHQDCPIANVIAAFDPKAVVNRNPLFSIAARHEAIHDALQDLRCDAVVTVTNDGDGLTGRIDFNTRLFDRSVVARVSEHIARVIAQGLSEPNRPLSEIEVLTEDERAQLSRIDVSPAATDASDVCTLFARQALQTPDIIAVAFGAEQISYRALDRRSNQLARHLRRLGIRPGARIGLHIRRSLDLIVAVLGVLKAGAAYVPLDPAFPDDRLRRVAAASGLAVLLTERALAEDAPRHADTVTLRVDVDWPRIASEAAAPLDTVATPEMLAYVMYTSGSTGEPKGVALTHRCLGNLVRWQIATYPVPLGYRTLQLTSVSFDVSFQEIFATLCAGGTLVLIAEQARRDPAQLVRVLRDGDVGRMFLPYAALHQLAVGASAIASLPESLHDLFVAGEQLQVSAPLIELLRRLPHCRLHNHYGPTESHVVTAFALDGIPSRWPRLPPIGRAIVNAAVFLTDSGLHLSPLGAPGEICIGGVSLGWGYLGAPKLTALKFVPCPFGGGSGGRLYRTGDIARMLPDGNIEFLGRSDDQVKIRGYRVEPGEVEIALLRHASVREAVVVPHENSGGRALVAYLVLREDQTATVEQLRAVVQRAVPDYAVPSDWIELDAFPLTPSGKIDRRSLPPPNLAKRLTVESYVAPRYEAEEVLADIWTAVLKRERIGVRDNFFDIGGHSLLATQAAARIRDEFQVELSITAFFEARTIERLAVEILRLQAADLKDDALRPLLDEIGGIGDGGLAREERRG